MTKFLTVFIILFGVTAFATDTPTHLECTVTYTDNTAGTSEEVGTYSAKVNPNETAPEFIIGVARLVEKFENSSEIKNHKVFKDFKIAVSGILSKDEDHFPSNITINYDFNGFRSSSAGGAADVEGGDTLIGTECEFVKK